MPDISDLERRASSTSKPEPDAYGQAALMLAESILHALVDKATFSSSEGVTIVEVAQEVKAELAANTGESEGRLQESLRLLSAIKLSFQSDAN